jgi:hypothetical protein
MNNKSDRAERASLLGSTGTTTYAAQAAIAQALDAGGGRWAAADKSAVVGETPAPMYPAQPAGSPWAGDPVGQEPPFPVDISAMEPVGTHAEIEASLAAIGSSAIAAKESEATVSPVPVAAPGVGGSPLAPTPDPHAQLAQLLPKIAIKRPRKW